MAWPGIHRVLGGSWKLLSIPLLLPCKSCWKQPQCPALWSIQLCKACPKFLLSMAKGIYFWQWEHLGHGSPHRTKDLHQASWQREQVQQQVKIRLEWIFCSSSLLDISKGLRTHPCSYHRVVQLVTECLVAFWWCDQLLDGAGVVC